MKEVMLRNKNNNSELSIVIVNWNVKNLLTRCLNSIYKTVKKIDFEIIVVDNASSDGSVKMVKDKFPTVILIENKVNVGFPLANNEAVKLSNGKLLLFINPDTEVHENAINKLYNRISKDDSIGIIGPKILLPNKKIEYNCARNFKTWYYIFFNIFFLKKLFPNNRLFGGELMGSWDHQETREIPCVNGACMLIKRDLFLKVGLFEKNMFFEDIDLCYKVKKVGKKILYLADASITHFSGVSRNAITDMEHYIYNTREVYYSHILFVKRYKTKFEYCLVRIIFVAGGIFRLFLTCFAFLLSLVIGRKFKHFDKKNIIRSIVMLQLGLFET
ncbi:glycosyltransferase family 2 protein [Planctomycetota bacterium]